MEYETNRLHGEEDFHAFLNNINEHKLIQPKYELSQPILFTVLFAVKTTSRFLFSSLVFSYYFPKL